jgi:DNA polymerase (family 10)
LRNVEVADLLERISYLLDAAGENRFKVIAFRRASNSVRNLDEDVEQVWKEKRLLEIPGIGEGIAKKIEEYLETEKIEYLQDLEKRVPPGATDLMKIPGVGPRTAFKLAQDHKVRSVEQLKQELSSGKLTTALGPVVSKKILGEIEKVQGTPKRMLLLEAMILAQEIKDYFSSRGITVEFAGSLRRGKSTVGDLDMLSLDEKSGDAFFKYPRLDRIIERGTTRSSVVLRNGVQVDLRVVKKEEYGAALLYFTGSKDHNVELRRQAIERGWKLNEYGIFQEEDGEARRVAGETETEVYAKLGLAYIEPEMRENRGEIEAAMKGRLPRLIQLDAVRGDMHTHSSWSDGREELEEMAIAAKARGYEYMTISDHSVGVGVANGLTEERFRKQWKVIERLNDELAPFRILRGVEAEVKGDGSLDFEGRFFEEFDFVGASIHQGYRQSPEKLTERAVKVLSNPAVDLLCHPTNRLIGRREGHPLDLTRVIRTAKENGKMLEIDGQPNRMDLDEIWARRAMEEGVPLVVDSDAHSGGELENVRFGIIVARRAWLEAKHVFNTLPLRDVMRRLGK